MIGSRPLGFMLALLLAAGSAGCAGRLYEPRQGALSLYESWDADRSGLLDPGEFAAGPYESWYGGAYDVWDDDGDGFITADEFGVGSRWPGLPASDRLADWDIDGSGYLDEEEVDEGTFERWDTDGNGMVGEDELYAGTYDSWDGDDDGFLSEDEFRTSIAAWLGDRDVGDFAAWDVDRSRLIDSREFYAGFSRLTA